MRFIEMRLAVTLSDIGAWTWTPDREGELLCIAKRLLREDFERQLAELTPQSWKEVGESHGHIPSSIDREETAGSHAVRRGHTGPDA